MQTAIATILIFGLVVIVHELGHFTAAKLANVKINEFAVGMGPKLFGKKLGETEYSLRAIPIGGFVRMEGEDEDSEDERSFNKKSVKARMGIVLAGAGMNFLLALVVFAIYFFAIGSPSNQISEINEGSPAYESGILAGDEIVEIDGVEIEKGRDITEAIGASESEEISVVVNRSGEAQVYSVVPELDSEQNRKVIGITLEVEKSLPDSIVSSFKVLGTIVGLMFELIGRLLRGNVEAGEISGPVGIVYLVGESVKYGFLYLMFIAGFISVNLGFFNLLPIPALDGSRFVFLLIEGLRGKPIDPEKEGRIHIIGFLLLMVLTVFITYRDLIKFNLF